MAYTLAMTIAAGAANTDATQLVAEFQTGDPSSSSLPTYSTPPGQLTNGGGTTYFWHLGGGLHLFFTTAVPAGFSGCVRFRYGGASGAYLNVVIPLNPQETENPDAKTSTRTAPGDAIASVTGNVGGSVGSVVGAVGSVTGNVAGNVTGSVGSVVGAVGSVTAPVTASTVTGSVGSVVGAVGSVTAPVTASAVTGNVGGSVGSVVGAVGSVTAPVTASTVTGNVGGSVASVVGAVGSVTGAVGSVSAPVVAASVTGNVGGTVGGNVMGSVGSVVGDVGGNVLGHVASVTGAVGSVTAPVMAASVTGNVSGNVVGSVGSVLGSVGSVTGPVALAAGEHTAIATTDVPAGLTAQHYTQARGDLLDVLNGLVLAIWAANSRTLTALGFNVAVSAPGPDDGGVVPLIIGDSYYVADGRALEWNLTGAPSLAGSAPAATATFSTSSGFSKAMTVVNPGQTVQTLRLELTAAETAALLPGNPSYAVQIVLSNLHPLTPIQGTLAVTPPLP